MERFVKKVILIITISLCTALIFAAPKQKGDRWVCAQNVQLKEKASVGSSKVAVLKYGDQVTIIEDKQKWIMVSLKSDSSVKGWLPATALTDHRIASGASNSSADAKEIALAGKGFNTTVEEVFAAGFNTDYSDVDFTEKQTVSYESNLDFMREGGLTVEEDKE